MSRKLPTREEDCNYGFLIFQFCFFLIFTGLTGKMPPITLPCCCGSHKRIEVRPPAVFKQRLPPSLDFLYYLGTLFSIVCAFTSCLYFPAVWFSASISVSSVVNCSHLCLVIQSALLCIFTVFAPCVPLVFSPLPF